MCRLLGAPTTAHHEYQCGIPSMQRHTNILLLSGTKHLVFWENYAINKHLHEDKVCNKWVMLFNLTFSCICDSLSF